MIERDFFLVPDWPAPPTVQSLVTTRRGGVSKPPYDEFNLGLHVGDDPAAVAANRARLRRYVPAEPFWLEQVHGIEVALAGVGCGVPVRADASVTREADVACVIMTADCLPVLFCDEEGKVVAAAHAGWRSLAAGVLEAALTAMAVEPGRVLAWLGPAIGPAAFEVGSEVRAAFLGFDPGAEEAFVPHGKEGKWLANIFALARRRLMLVGVGQDRVYGGGVCTVSESGRFYSYRRDAVTGRFASMVWLSAQGHVALS
ncbi:MAG: peptidoglycan editing factor PgeF [Betaproteobacteria bacterium]|nr:peptidoglycan editing factor PgeF [Betaproteobacteria bacterium]